MIRFDRLWETMEKKGISTYTLREKCGIDSKTVRRLRANDNMETKTLNKICIALDCSLTEIAEFVREEDESV
jgi:DNA-binding Xre family transcriptional regulator